MCRVNNKRNDQSSVRAQSNHIYCVNNQSLAFLARLIITRTQKVVAQTIGFRVRAHKAFHRPAHFLITWFNTRTIKFRLQNGWQADVYSHAEINVLLYFLTIFQASQQLWTQPVLGHAEGWVPPVVLWTLQSHATTEEGKGETWSRLRSDRSALTGGWAREIGSTKTSPHLIRGS